MSQRFVRTDISPPTTAPVYPRAHLPAHPPKSSHCAATTSGSAAYITPGPHATPCSGLVHTRPALLSAVPQPRLAHPRSSHTSRTVTVRSIPLRVRPSLLPHPSAPPQPRTTSAPQRRAAATQTCIHDPSRGSLSVIPLRLRPSNTGVRSGRGADPNTTWCGGGGGSYAFIQ